jgi:hypothetical protein
MCQYVGGEDSLVVTEQISPDGPTDRRPHAASTNIHRIWRHGALAAIASLAVAGLLTACSSSPSSDSGENNLSTGQGPAQTPAQPVAPASSPDTFKIEQVWGPDGCVENLITSASGTVATQATDLCRAPDLAPFLAGVTSYYLYRRGYDPIKNEIEIRGFDSDGTVYWEYTTGDTYRKPVIGNVQIYVRYSDGSTGFEDIATYESGTQINFLQDVEDSLADTALISAANTVAQPSYSESSSAATTAAQTLYQQRQSNLSQEAAQAQAAEKEAQQQEELDQEYVWMGKINGQETGVMPQGCDEEGQVSCDS